MISFGAFRGVFVVYFSFFWHHIDLVATDKTCDNTTLGHFQKD